MLKRVWASIGRDHVSTISAGIAFFALFAIFPAIAALVMLAGIAIEPPQLESVIDSYAEATQKGRARESVHAEHVRGHVEHAVQRWQMEGGRTEEGQPARVRWAWSALGPLAATLVFLVVALLAG